MEGVHVGVSGHISNQDVERPGQVHGFVVPFVGTSKGSALILLESTPQWPVELPGGLHLCSATAPPSPATKGAIPPTQGTFGEQLEDKKYLPWENDIELALEVSGSCSIMPDRLIVGIEFCCINEKNYIYLTDGTFTTVDCRFKISVSLFVYSTSLLSPLQDLFICLCTQGLYFQMGNFFQ